MILLLVSGKAGSPPHTRGKGRSHVEHLAAEGITPAYAGKSFLERNDNSWLKDHPRIRGEKSLMKHKKALTIGSPPHTRGKVSTELCQIHHSRITPAYAGKSPTGLPRPHRPRDHPRIRGEKKLGAETEHREKGSPPHTRGKETFGLLHLVAVRITPAYAGKSYCCWC